MRIALLLVGWAMGVGFGAYAMLDYQMTPGESATVPDRWPSNSVVQLDLERPTLLLFAHPKCPCTAATFSELERMLTVVQNLVVVHVVFIKPADTSTDWEESGLWGRATGIPNVSTNTDTGGELTQLFGVATSGTVVLYNTSGEKIFDGGITSSRGHEGDNAGVEAIKALLHGHDIRKNSTTVFGCQMQSPGESVTEE